MMNHIGEDTICAVATAEGQGGVAIVRVSGKRSRELLEAIFQPARANSLEGRHLAYGHAVYKNEIIDEVLAVFMAAPATYTREDMAEIHCHGGSVCARRVIDALIASGARPAEAGEFTKRAFLNGRIDLAEAEAVMALIGADSEVAARAGLRQLEGGVSGFVKDNVKKIRDMLALIEACIDFPDEVDEADVAARVRAGAVAARDDLLSRIDERGARLIREGASIVLAGRPNVGKSSLMNALLRQERAIVTDIPGTTRDVLTESVMIGGVRAQLSDTAGQRETDDPIERIGVSRAEAAMARADIVLIVIDDAGEMTDEDRALLARADERAVICLNKCDLPGEKIEIPGAIHLSARTGEGVDDLAEELSRRLIAARPEAACLTAQRHIALARAACEALDRAIEAIDNELSTDMVAIDLMAALGELCDITGENASEAVIDSVFKNFCVGK